VGVTVAENEVVGVTEAVRETDGDAHKYDECSDTHWPMPPSLTGNTPSLSHNTSLTYHSLDVPTSTPCHPASQ
jgi:hypothetical protein